MSQFLHRLAVFAVISIPALAVDGVTLIDQATVTAAGGFPYVISQPGSYRLSGNLVVPNTNGISITAANVTLDLNGFSITCQSCSVSPNGIVSLSDATTVVNRVISGFPHAALWFKGSLAVADRLTISQNYGGILAARDLTATNSTVASNSGVGVEVQGGMLTLTNCRILGNSGGGATLTTGTSAAAVSSNVFVNNGTAGHAFGALTLSGAAVVNSNAFLGNANSAIQTGAGPLVYSSNTFKDNVAAVGIAAVSGGNNACLVGGITQLC